MIGDVDTEKNVFIYSQPVTPVYATIEVHCSCITTSTSPLLQKYYHRDF